MPVCYNPAGQVCGEFVSIISPRRPRRDAEDTAIIAPLRLGRGAGKRDQKRRNSMADQPSPAAGRARARDLGIRLGRLAPGPANAITDVPGVRVGHTTLIQGDPGPLVVGQGPVRTGVTVIQPHEGDPGRDPVFAGYHALNGNGEMTGLLWSRSRGCSPARSG
jgi:hypothetical protein